MVLSYALWQRRFGGGPKVVNKVIRLDGNPVTVVRLLEERDVEKAPLVAVIDETMARAYWPGEDPLGKRFRFGGFGQTDEPWMTVVGIVGNVRHSGLHVDPRPQLYIPQAQIGSGPQYFVLRTEGDPKRLIKDARAAIFAVDRDQPVSKVLTMEQVMAGSMAGRQFNMVLLGVFAALALVALFAAYLPGRRATRVDPMVAFRAD